MRTLKTLLTHGLLALLAIFTSVAHAAVSHTVGAGVGLIATKNTTSFYQGFTWQGTTRSVLFIRPSSQPAGSKAAAIVMLHYDTGTPELQANLSHAGNLAAQMGYWVILPPAINGHWHDDPSDTSTTTDDVGFLTQVIKTATSQYPIDATRVSMAGLSNGGFMTTRMACQAPQLLASAVAVAAEMRKSMAAICRPSRPVPMVFVMGSADPLVAYNGNYQFTGAKPAFGTWTSYAACNTADTSTTQLPVIANDGTTVTLQHNAVCTSLGEADLYTVNNGGHAWPGANTTMGGIVTKNLDATTMLGNFAKLYTNKSTI
jgi:polyhydroxybutyrate depolymerase